MTGLMAVCVSAARMKDEAPLTAQGEKLLAAYTGILELLKAEIAAAAPAMDAQKKAAFLDAHAAVAAVPARPNPQGLKLAPPRYAPSYEPYAAAQAKSLVAARAILADVETFLASDKLDAKLAKCALLAHATPRRLAEFAQQSKDCEALMDRLLNDEALIRQIMAMDGAYEGMYGQSMEIYAAIQKASKRAHEGFFQRWALAVSLENPAKSGTIEQGLTAAELGVSPEEADGNAPKAARTAADGMVEMYLNYEQAYLDGKMDPAFNTLSDFNYRFVFPDAGRTPADVTWMREMLRNYRPDHIVDSDYKWRYCRIVKTDIPYTSGVKRPVRPDLGLTGMQEYFLEGGVCGPRAFTGRLATSSFGIPTRRATQPGHAAMCHWTPDGWVTVFGAHWTFNHDGGRCGLDFVLETQARDKPEEFMKVLRAQWLGDAFAEEKVNPMAYGIGGSPWKALAFYKELAIVEDAKIAEVAGAGAELAESNVATEAEKIPSIEIPETERKITVAPSGAITIPAAACSSPTESSEKIRFMKTIDGKGVQVHYSLGGGRPELIRYIVEAPAAGKYELALRVVTVTLDRTLMLRLNRRTMVDVALPYTCGMWKDTKPVTIELNEGRNALEFTSRVPNKGVSIKYLTLTPAGK